MKTNNLRLVAAAFAALSPAFAGVIPVYPGDPNWTYFDDTTDQVRPSQIVSTPGPSDDQNPGSVNMSFTADIVQGVNHSVRPLVATTQYAGTLLSSLSTLTYETLIVPNTDTTAAPFFQLGIGLGNDQSFIGRLTWVPTASLVNGNAATLDQSGNWQTWDPLNAVGGWFFTRPSSFSSNPEFAAESCYLANNISTADCSLSAIIARHPTLELNANPLLGILGVRSNSSFGPNSQLPESSYTDRISVGIVDGQTNTFDFGTPEPATWSTLGTALLGLGFAARKKLLRKA